LSTPETNFRQFRADPHPKTRLLEDGALVPTEVRDQGSAVPKKRLAPSRVSGGVDGRYLGRALSAVNTAREVFAAVAASFGP
jgi:hypothetical protein